MTIVMYILCRDEKSLAAWENRKSLYPRMKIVAKTGYASYYKFISDSLMEAESETILIGHDDIWLGRGFESRVSKLIQELDAKMPLWGVVGNAGIGVDGKAVFRYVHDAHGGPERTRMTIPVSLIEGALMLLSATKLLRHGFELPDLGSFQGYDIVTSCECYRAGLAVLVDPRLFVVHLSGGDRHGFDSFASSNRFRDYWKDRFVNHSIATMKGPIDLSEACDFEFNACHKDPTDGLIDLYGKILEVSGLCAMEFDRDLAIVCRTRLQRPAMFERLVSSVAALNSSGTKPFRLKFFVLTNESQECLDEALQTVRRLAPDLDADGRRFEIRGSRFSRTDLMLHAFERIETTYIWFVDDDDFVFPQAIQYIAWALSSLRTPLIIGDCVVYEEEWDHSSGDCVLSREVYKRPGDLYPHVFSGDNYIPVCGICYPREPMRKILQGAAADGDYSEDYYVLLKALTNASMDVLVIESSFAGISLRKGGSDNTVTQTDRSEWQLSYATFIGELMEPDDPGAPICWSMYKYFARTNHRGAEQAQFSKELKRLVKSYLLKRPPLNRWTRGVLAKLPKSWRSMIRDL